MWESLRLEKLDLDRHWPGLEDLLADEDWPLQRWDFELSLRQPRAAAVFATLRGRPAGFLTAHAFGDIGYLATCVVAKDLRGRGLGGPIYLSAMRELRRQGVRAVVTHLTKDVTSQPERFQRMKGYVPGPSFTLLSRPPGPVDAATSRPVRLGAPDLEALTALDAAVFGLSRPQWHDALLAWPERRCLGLRREDGSLAASLGLRPRKGGGYLIEGAVGARYEDLRDLVTGAVASASGRDLQCFCRVGSPLEGHLGGLGFSSPAFFGRIGPLVEWRLGETGPAGTSPLVQTLAWM